MTGSADLQKASFNNRALRLRLTKGIFNKALGFPSFCLEIAVLGHYSCLTVNKTVTPAVFSQLKESLTRVVQSITVQVLMLTEIVKITVEINIFVKSWFSYLRLAQNCFLLLGLIIQPTLDLLGGLCHVS